MDSAWSPSSRSADLAMHTFYPTTILLAALLTACADGEQSSASGLTGVTSITGVTLDAPTGDGTGAATDSSGGVTTDQPTNEPTTNEPTTNEPTTNDPTADPTADPTGAPPVDCGPIGAHADWEVCFSEPDRCIAVFGDGAGCAAVCAAAGLECEAVFEDVSGQCAPNLQLPELACDPPSGHQSDYCVCARPGGECRPTCGGKTCGPDGCGGNCGACEGGDSCVDGQCTSLGTCDTYPYSPAALLAERAGFGAAATGGDPGKVYHVTTLKDGGAGSLRAALESDTAYWIVFDVDGTIVLGGADHRLYLKGDKTIDGRGRDITVNGELRIQDITNVIISDIRLTNTLSGSCGQTGDVLLIRGDGDDDPNGFSTRDIWLHHVEAYEGGDGLVDIRGGSRVTISWSHFHDHAKGMLMWKDADNLPAPGMRVTLHHNYFDRLSRRGPQFSYGWAHFYNNYQFEWYEFGAGGIDGAEFLSERNIYEARPGDFCIPSCPDPNPCGDNDFTVSKEGLVFMWASDAKGSVRSTGDLKLNDAVLATNQPDQVFDPKAEYDYVAEPATAALKQQIAAEAGPRVDYCK
jgi:pectate lyase